MSAFCPHCCESSMRPPELQTPAESLSDLPGAVPHSASHASKHPQDKDPGGSAGSAPSSSEIPRARQGARETLQGVCG